MSRQGLARTGQLAASSANRLIRALNAYAEAPPEAEGALRRLIKKEIVRLVRCCIGLYLRLLIFAKKTGTPVEQSNRSASGIPDLQDAQCAPEGQLMLTPQE